MNLQKINYQQGAQTVLNLIASYFIFVSFNQEFTPHQILIYMLGVQWILHVVQWFKKIPVTLVFILIIGWTISGMVHWPGQQLMVSLGWKDYATGVGSILFALSGWLMHSYNTKRW